MKRNTIHKIGGGSGDETLKTTDTKRFSVGSRIPSPTRTPATYTGRRSSRASTPQRSRSSSMSPTRGGALSPSYSTRSLENLSPIRTDQPDLSRSRELPPETGGGRNLVRYITPDLIKRLAKEDQFEHVKTLNFTLSGEKKIKYIENLDGLKNLTTLNCTGNIIKRIEKLDHLTNLKQLNLSNNRISKIEGLEQLVNLQTLNLEGNYIEKVPLWLVKRLRLLRTIKLANNNILSLTDAVRLRGCHDLHMLTIAGNPLCELPHHRLYIIFHLRVLNQLDGTAISSTERNEATARFSQEELDRLTRELHNTSNQLQQSQELHNRSVEEIEILAARERDLHEKEVRGQESREELERQLDTKDDLLKKKAKELQRAQTKQYQLEQELAFIKLDAKFEPINMPRMDSDEEEDIPYIGKSRFKKNQMAVESTAPGSKQQFTAVDGDTRRQLDGQLEEKQRQLNEAAERLAGLQRELRETQKQVVEATQELHKLERAATERRLTEAEKQKLRQRLAAKIQRVNQLKDEVENFENAIAGGRAEVQRLKLDYDELRARLKSLDPNSPEYAQTRSEMALKEAQVKDLTHQIKENEGTLNQLLKNIAVDTEAIRQLEEQLEKGTTSSDDALRHELEEIVGGLQDYLLNVRQKADAQRAEFDQLLRDKERLVRRLAALEQEKSILSSDVDDYSQLQQQLDALNRSMNDMQELNNALQTEANELSVHDAELQKQLEDAEKRIEELHRSMQESDRKNQSDKATLSKQMEEMARLQNNLDDRKAEAVALKKEVGKLKGHNRDLAGQLENSNQRYRETLNAMLRPGEVVHQIGKLNEALRKGDRATAPSGRDKDPIARALHNLNETIFGLVDKENEDKEKAEKALQALEKHMANLKKKLAEAQQEYKTTMEAATEAKIEAEKRKHENALQTIDGDVNVLKERLKEAEEDAVMMRTLAQNERAKREEEVRAREEKARLVDAQSQAALRDLERELGATRRGIKDRDIATSKELEGNRAKIEALHRKLEKLEAERADEMLKAVDAEKTADEALRDLAQAEEEIGALQDLLRAHEGNQENGRGYGTIRKLRDTLAVRQNEVGRLKKALRARKGQNLNEIADLTDEVDALRDALASNHQRIRSLWPGYYYYIPEGGKSPGQWKFTPQKSVPVPFPTAPPPPPSGAITIQGVPVDPAACHGLQPGTPGTIAVQEDGTLVLIPFEGLYCNVQEHHHLEDDVAALQEALERCKEKRKAEKEELEEAMNIVGPVQDLDRKLNEIKEEIKSHKDVLEKLKQDEERMSQEKQETAKELADLKDTLTNKLNRKHQLEGRVEELLGELRTEEAMMQQEEMQEELAALERTIAKKRAELRDAERMLRAARENADLAEEKAEAMVKRFENARSNLNEAEQDAEELERQASDTGMKLVRARNELRQLQDQVKDAEGRQIQLDDQCRQLTRLVTNKEAEFTALEQKTDHMTGNLERLQSELIVTEEKEAERLAALRESEKVLAERREELNKLKEQANAQREELEGLDRLMGKKTTEIQLLQENIEQHQNELSIVLKEGKADVQEKQKQIKQLRHDVDELSSTKSDLESQIIRRKGEIAGIRENTELASEELQNKISEVNKQKAELKHVLEMLGLEQQELDSLRRQHEVKSSELADTQRRMLEERSELEKINSDVQRREADLSRIKQNVEKLRSDVDCLTSQRSTLEDTVMSFTKEKDMLMNTASNLEDKIQIGKKNLYEIRTGIDKSGATLDQLEQELTHVRKEAFESNQQKNALNKEITSLRSAAKDVQSDLSSYKSELQDTQDQLQLVEQDLRAATKLRDDAALEAISLREEIKTCSHQMEMLTQQVRRKQDEAQRAEDNARERREELSEKEMEIQRLTREIEREEEKLQRTITNLNGEVQRLQTDLCEQRDELEATIIKRDATKRDMERLGRLEGKYEETEAQIKILESRIAEREREVLQLQRERSDLRGSLSSTEGELRACKVESGHETKRLQQRVDELKEENERARSKSGSEISSLEKMAQDHCERATRLSNELNQLRSEYIQIKKEMRFNEEDRAKERRELQRAACRIRDEIDDKVEEGVLMLDTSHSEAVKDLNELYHERESAERKLNTLKEIQKGKSPPRRSFLPRNEDKTMQTLQEDLKAKQEEIASQIRRQMSRHREQWQARKQQSEGKIRSLKKKVDNLDELVSNTSMDSLSYSRGRDLSPIRALPSLDERENIFPERDHMHSP
ncbi:centriolin-like [Clavelina lepadiformis]|uniref:centriolin-like n=1 Tax=Clavelina lepadiformis TaxID=159417 RepID=UPI004042A8FD